MDWHDIPSLSALRAFEAAARLKNQSKAAAELNVTHAAINQHIRALEKNFGVLLFFREGRNTTLTNEGKALFDALSQGFSNIALGVAQLRRQRNSIGVSVTVTPSLYQNWLLRHINDFWATHPDIKLNLNPDVNVRNLADGYDIALRFGDGKWKGLNAIALDMGALGVFVSEQYLSTNPDLSKDLTAARWIIPADAPEVSATLAKMGVDLDAEHHLHIDCSSNARAALIGGNGLSLQHERMLEIEVAHGMVREILATDFLRPNLGYYAVYDPVRLDSCAKKFLDWLLLRMKQPENTRAL